MKFKGKVKGQVKLDQINSVASSVKPFGLAIADTNGENFPEELLSKMFSDPVFFSDVTYQGSEQILVNTCKVTETSSATYINGEFHVELLDLPTMEAIRAYNEHNDTYYSEYYHIFLISPVRNPHEVPLCINLSSSQFWNFRDMHTEELQQEVNGSMSAMMLPKSDRIMFEFAKACHKTTLCGSYSENIPPEHRPSLHIFLGGTIPKTE